MVQEQEIKKSAIKSENTYKIGREQGLETTYADLSFWKYIKV